MIRRVTISAATAAVTAAVFVPGVSERGVANALVVAIAVLSLMFTGVYGLLSNWRSTPGGRALLYVTAALCAFSTQVAVSIYSGKTYWLYDELRLLLYAGLVLTMVNLVWTWWLEQK